MAWGSCPPNDGSGDASYVADEGTRDDDGGLDAAIRSAGEELRAQQEAVAAMPARPRKQTRKRLRKQVRKLEQARDAADSRAARAGIDATEARQQRERVFAALAEAGLVYVKPDRTDGDRARAATAGVVLLDEVEIGDVGLEVDRGDPETIDTWSKAAFVVLAAPQHVVTVSLRSATAGTNYLASALQGVMRRRRPGG